MLTTLCFAGRQQKVAPVAIALVALFSHGTNLAYDRASIQRHTLLLTCDPLRQRFRFAVSVPLTAFFFSVNMPNMVIVISVVYAGESVSEAIAHEKRSPVVTIIQHLCTPPDHLPPGRQNWQQAAPFPLSGSQACSGPSTRWYVQVQERLLFFPFGPRLRDYACLRFQGCRAKCSFDL